MNTTEEKYFKGVIHYEGIQRVDRFPVYKDSMREAILNAIVHKDYGSYNPIQIKVFLDRVYVFNSCRFPDKWTEKMLFRTHDSVRINPNIATAIFKTGMIETWGRGIAKMVEGCKRIGTPDPVYEVLPRNISLMFEAPANGVYQDKGDKKAIKGDEQAIKPSDRKQAIVEYLQSNIEAGNAQIAELLNLGSSRTRVVLNAMAEEGIIEKVGDKRATVYRLIIR